MPTVVMPVLRVTMAAAAIAALGLTAPQASAADTTTAADVEFSPRADAATRAIAVQDPQAVQASATLCGTGYALVYAERLPESTDRKGTLFTYTKGTTNACAVFDNNTASTKYMKLKLCDNRVNGVCNTDEGNFSQYAGPVRITSNYIGCSKVTAIMKYSSTSSTALIDRVTYATPCN